MADLSQFGLAPVGFGGGFAGPPQGGPSAPSVSVTPDPDDDPMAWISIAHGEFRFPAVRGQGTAIAKPTSAQKLDEQTSPGTAKAKTKRTGVSPCKGTIAIRGLRQFWNSVGEPFLNGIDPNGVSHGGPFETKHPDINRRNCKNVMIVSVGPVIWEPGGGMFTCDYEWSEWVDPKAVGGKGGKGGAVTVPTEGQQYQENAPPLPDRGPPTDLQRSFDIAARINAALAGPPANSPPTGLMGADAPNSGVPQ